jgi:CHAT domain-containing protein
MKAVRSLLDDADFDSASRLSDWCLHLVIDLNDPVANARANVTKGITLARVNDNINALSYFDAAIRLFEDADDEHSAAKVRVNRVACYRQLGRYDEALRDGEITKQVFTRVGDKQMLARSLNNLGAVFFLLDRFQDWVRTLDQAVRLLQEIGDEKSLAMLYVNRAVAFTSLNRNSEAVESYRLSRELCRKSGQTWLGALSNYNLGYLYYTQGEYTRALNALAETRSVLSLDPWHISLCDLTQAEIYLEINMYRDGIHFAETAYKGFEALKKPFEMAKAIGVQAVAHSQLREFKEAGRLFQKARAMFQEQGNEVRAAGMDLYRGVMWLQMGLNADARAVARTAYDAFMKESVKPKAAFARIVSARASLRLADLEEACDDATIAKTLNDESPLPSVSHQLHALLGEINQAQNNLPSARDEFLRAITELEDVRSQIAADELRLNYLKDKVPVYEMLMHTDLRLGDLAHLEEAFETAERAKSRTLVDLLAGSVDPLKQASSSSLEDIRQTLAPDAVLVEYVMVRDSVVAFCVSRDRFAVVQNVCSKAELKKTFGFLQFHLSRFPSDQAAKIRPAMALANIQAHLKTLYGMLVRPIEHWLSDKQSVIFVPSDLLHYLPFHALFDGSAYLADRFTISYAPTATIYRLFVERPVEHKPEMLLIGVPDEAAPVIADEIESIQSVLPNARAFIGDTATRDRLTQEMETAGMIHIASHATFRPDNPMFSSFQLYDGPMNFFDIYNLRTSASLITLSGCGTGLSNVVAGDELLGLVRGFLYAGATSVVLSLWDVNDRTTADLMKYFYGSLAEGKTKGVSLRSAMLRLRDEHPHPYYWAPFLLMGNPS